MAVAVGFGWGWACGDGDAGVRVAAEVGQDPHDGRNGGGGGDEGGWGLRDVVGQGRCVDGTD